MPVLADTLAALALEVDRRGVEEHEFDVAEQIAPAGEQLLLDQVLAGANVEGGGVLGGRCQRLAEETHRAVQVVQRQLLDAGDRLLAHPALGGAVAAADEQAMQHGHEYRALERELESSLAQQVVQDRVNARLLPQPLEDQRRADAARAGGDALAATMRAEHGELVGEAAQGGQQTVELARGLELIESSQPMQHALLDAAVYALALNQQKVGSSGSGLGAQEHEAVPLR
jgi:hypothetical protein